VGMEHPIGTFGWNVALPFCINARMIYGLSQGGPDQRPVLSKVQARQGVTGRNVRYVLWFGLAAAIIIAFAAIYLFYFYRSP
jgi:hypothetical protein